MSVAVRFGFLASLVLAIALIAAGKNCETLDGKWYSQLGSEIYLRHGSDGRLQGEYRTAAEGFGGSTVENHSVVLGKYCRKYYDFCVEHSLLDCLERKHSFYK